MVVLLSIMVEIIKSEFILKSFLFKRVFIAKLCVDLESVFILVHSDLLNKVYNIRLLHH